MTQLCTHPFCALLGLSGLVETVGRSSLSRLVRRAPGVEALPSGSRRSTVYLFGGVDLVRRQTVGRVTCVALKDGRFETTGARVRYDAGLDP